MNDAQFSKTFILRPYSTFATDYEGQDTATVPIMFTELGDALDKNAGKPGYDDNLIRGVPVPMGARALLWLPRVFAQIGGDYVPYDWHLIWRLRNVFDFRQTRQPFHYPKQGTGAPNAGDPRVVIPASFHTIVYNQTEPAAGANQSQHLVQEQVLIEQGTSFIPAGGQPLVPGGGTGVIQQGVLPLPNEVLGDLPSKPCYMVHEVMCAGDELLLGVTRAGTAPNNVWDFTGGLTPVDRIFNIMFGSGDILAPNSPYVDVGVYLHVGTSV